MPGGSFYTNKRLSPVRFSLGNTSMYVNGAIRDALGRFPSLRIPGKGGYYYLASGGRCSRSSYSEAIFMKRTFFSIAFLVVLFAVQAVSAQTEKRIQFAKGKTSATVSGLTGANGLYYVVRARSGQMLIVTVTPRSGVGIKVEKEGRFGHEVLLREERGGTYQVGLEESGDVTIFLGSTSGKSAAFTMTVKIVKMTDI